jgi:hypothetical protein
MLKVGFAMCAAWLALFSSVALAGPSYESRGYGGPLYVGPNFQKGGQHETPTYEKKTYQKKKTYKKTRSYEAKKPSKTKAAEKSGSGSAGPGAASAGVADPTNENSTISGVTAAANETAGQVQKTKASAPVDCKKYFPAAGITATVECD